MKQRHVWCVVGLLGLMVGMGCYRSEPSYEPPEVAIVSSDVSAQSGDPVTVKGVTGESFDNDEVTFQWDVVEKPQGSEAGFGDTGFSREAIFTADKPGKYTLRFTARDGSEKGSATLVVTALNRPPVAHAGLERSTLPGVAVTLTGNQSSDPEDESLTYLWECSDWVGDKPFLEDSETVSAVFKANTIGVYTLMLTVNDGIDSHSDTMQVVVYEPTLPLPDTGQTKSFTDVHGEDNDYQRPRKLIRWKAPDTASLEGENFCMVHDAVTGLTWEVKDAGNANDTYTWYDADPETNGGYAGLESGNTTASFLETLNEDNFGGYNDWRLPTYHEFQTILDFSLDPTCLDPDYFPYMSSNRIYWTSETLKTSGPWAVATSPEGWSNSSLKEKVATAHVIAVRGGPGQPAVRLTDNEDGTVTDLRTGLMWQQGTGKDGEILGFEDAIRYCEDLKLAGYNDWRMPDMMELRSIVFPESGNNVWYDTVYFPEMPNGGFHSSTHTETYQHVVEQFTLFKGSSANSGSLRVRAVRGGVINILP